VPCESRVVVAEARGAVLERKGRGKSVVGSRYQRTGEGAGDREESMVACLLACLLQ
jgi:hypothetical protein